VSVVLERERVVPTYRALSPEEKARIRARLAEAIRSFWASPEGQALRMELSRTVRSLGWDTYMESIMEGHKAEMSATAKRIGLDKALRLVWGKG